MGIYLNPGAGLFRMALNSEIYVDKSDMIAVLNRMVNTERRFVCVSRPRRFGKSLTANMLAAYYDGSDDGGSLFRDLKLGGMPDGLAECGRYDVIKVNVQEFLSAGLSMAAMLERLQLRVIREICRAYPDIDYFDKTHLADTFGDVFAGTRRQFVIIFDEWDCIFREYPHDENSTSRLFFRHRGASSKPFLPVSPRPTVPPPSPPSGPRSNRGVPPVRLRCCPVCRCPLRQKRRCP